MTLTKQEIKQAIRDNLPTGYVSKLHVVLKQKFSESYIGQVCDPNNQRWNQEIIDAATELAIDNKRNKKKVEKKINELL